MTKKTIIILGMFLGIGKIVSAQSGVNDLVRYSGIQYQGTARSAGAGNAFGAVGADFVGIGFNPAGLGLYQRSEFSGTLGYDETTAKSTYFGNSISNLSDPNFNVGNVGIVIANNKKQKGKDVSSGWFNVNWGIGFTRTNNFYANTIVEGNNTNNSILTNWKENANNQNSGPSGLGFGTTGALAFQTFLIDPSVYDSTNYADRTKFDSKINVKQTDQIITTGTTNNISLSVAGNYLGKFYLGATINVPTLSFTSDRTFTEKNNNQNSSNDSEYVSSSLSQTLTTNGIGINAALGAIYKFNDMFRIGLSVQLPTVYSLTDISAISITGQTSNNPYIRNGAPIGGAPVEDSASQPNGFQYSIITPARTTLSGAMFFNQNGFLSVDYEYVDYSSARLSGNSYINLNQIVKNELQGVNTLRIGAEYRIQAFSIRAGYNYISSPYKSGLAIDGYDDTYSILSFGVGFRAGKMGLDLTYQIMTNNSTYTPYTLNAADAAQYGYAPSANVTTSRGNLMLSFTTRF